MVGEGVWVRLPKVDFCGEGVWVILGKVEGVRKAGCVRKLRVSQLRKAVRGTDSLLFATEGRIGGLGGERRFCGLNLTVPLGGGCSGGAVFRRMYRAAI